MHFDDDIIAVLNSARLDGNIFRRLVPKVLDGLKNILVPNLLLPLPLDLDRPVIRKIEIGNDLKRDPGAQHPAFREIQLLDERRPDRLHAARLQLLFEKSGDQGFHGRLPDVLGIKTADMFDRSLSGPETGNTNPRGISLRGDVQFLMNIFLRNDEIDFPSARAECFQIVFRMFMIHDFTCRP